MKTPLTRILRAGVALTLAGVVLVIGWYFLSHRRRPSVVAPKVEEITPEKVERQEGIEHFEYRGERTIRVKAARHFVGEDGSNHLEGNVEIRQIGKEGKEEILLSGQKVAYDKDWTNASIEGQAVLKYGRLTVESDFFAYQDSSGILATDRGVRFFSTRLTGKATRMIYSFKDDFLSLEDQVEIRLSEDSASPAPFIIAAAVVTYSRQSKTGEARGSVAFSWDQSSGQCEDLRFILTQDELYANQLFLSGDVKVDLVEEVAAPPPGKKLLLAAAKTRQIAADEVSLLAFLNMHKIHAVEAKGNCSLNSAPAGGGLLQSSSGEMRFVFDRWGGLREFRASGRASLTERSQDNQLVRIITGGEIFIEGQGEQLSVKAAERGEARIDSPDSEVTAAEIILVPRSERVDAAGDVKVVLKTGASESPESGFFSGSDPVFITTQKMRSDPVEKRLIIRGNARMWQGKQILSADELTVWKGSGAISGQGNVRAAFPYVPRKEEKKEDRIEVGGKRLAYASETRLLTLDQEAWLKTQKIGLSSDAVIVHLRKGQGEVENIEAKGRVVITEGTRQGKGAEALYDLDKETIVLTGNPSLVDKEKGTVEGDKLTFHLGDGRILVENKDRERPVTFIKS